MDGGAIDTTNRALSGRGGDIKISAESILLDGRAGEERSTGIGARSIVLSLPRGIDRLDSTSGNIEISTTRLDIISGAGIDTSTLGGRDGGSITINADSILIDDNQSLHRVVFALPSDGGQITGN